MSFLGFVVDGGAYVREHCHARRRTYLGRSRMPRQTIPWSGSFLLDSVPYQHFSLTVRASSVAVGAPVLTKPISESVLGSDIGRC